MIGEKIKARREELGISQKELAEKADLTSGFLSQIERNLSEPSISSLRKIAKVLNVAVFYFLIEEEAVCPVVKKADKKVLKSLEGNITYELLTPHMDTKIEMFTGRLSPGIVSSGKILSLTGEETIHILEGQMKIALTDEQYILDVGDTVYFQSKSFESLENCGETELVFISAITPPVF